MEIHVKIHVVLPQGYIVQASYMVTCQVLGSTTGAYRLDVIAQEAAI